MMDMMAAKDRHYFKCILDGYSRLEVALRDDASYVVPISHLNHIRAYIALMITLPSILRFHFVAGRMTWFFFEGWQITRGFCFGQTAR